MSGLIASFKRYFIFAFLVLLVVILLWLKFVVAPKTPQGIPLIVPTPLPSVPAALLSPEVNIQQSPNVLPGKQIKLSYKGPAFTAPETLPVYTPEGPSQITADEAAKYAEKYGLSGTPNVSQDNWQKPSFFLWQEGEKIFSVGGSFPAIHFNNYTVLQYVASPSSSIGNSLLINKSQEELTKLNVKNVAFDSPVFSYFKTGLPDSKTGEFGLLETQTKEEASYFGVGLTYKLAGFEIISDAPRNLPIFLIFDGQGNLFELTVFLFSPASPTSSIKITPFEKALNNLNNKGVIFSTFSKKELNKKDLVVYDINNIDLSSVKIAYFLPVSFTTSILPYYVFSGVGQDQQTKMLIDITVFLSVAN